MFNWFKKKARPLERLRAEKLEALLNGDQDLINETARSAKQHVESITPAPALHPRAKALNEEVEQLFKERVFAPSSDTPGRSPNPEAAELGPTIIAQVLRLAAESLDTYSGLEAPLFLWPGEKEASTGLPTHSTQTENKQEAPSKQTIN